MIDVYTRVNHCYDTCASDAKAVLRILKPDDLGRGLRSVAVPNSGAVIIHRGGVVETGGHAAE